MKRVEKYAPWILALASAALFYGPLGSHALWDSDEGRYAEIAREMLQLKDWITPHLNYVLYFEKPPLMYWLTALSMMIFGQNAFAARFWCATFGVLTVLVTSHWGKRWKSERVGLLAGGILATSLGFFALTQYVVLDMALTFWMTLTLFSASVLLLGRRVPEDRSHAYLLALAIAGGLLTKGPVEVVLPSLALCGVVTRYRGRRRTRVQIPWGPAFLLCVLITLPWFIAVTLRHPIFPEFFLVHEHLERFLTNVHHRNQPFYFFIPVLALGFFPWIVFLPKAVTPWVSRRRAALERDPEGALLVGWSLLVFVFFSLSHSKLVAYILPMFPALALLVAHELDSAWEKTPMPSWVGWGVVTLILIFTGGLFVLKGPIPLPVPEDPLAATLMGQSDLLALILGLGIFVLVGAWGMRRTWACFGGLVLVQVLLLAGFSAVASLLDPYLSTRSLAQKLTERLQPDQRVVAYAISYENRLQTLPFYAEQRVAVFGDPGELALGRTYDPDSASWFVPEEAEQTALLQRPAGTWGITDEEHWKSLQAAAPSDTFDLAARQGALVLFQKVR